MELEQKGQEMNYIREITLNKIEDFYQISDQNEFQEKIFMNTFQIAKILNVFNKLLYEKFVLSKKEAEILLHCLNFVDMMNLFIHPNEMDKIGLTIRSIKEQISMINNLDLKEEIMKKIKYTEKSFIYYKKKLFKTLFFKDAETIYREFDEMLNNLMDQRYLKQLQNAFYIFQQKIDEEKRVLLQNKISLLKEKNKSMKRSVEQGWSNQQYYYNNYTYNSYYKNQQYNTYDDAEIDINEEEEVHKDGKEIPKETPKETVTEFKDYKNTYSNYGSNHKQHHYHSSNAYQAYNNNYYNNNMYYNDYNYNLGYNNNYKYNNNYYVNKQHHRSSGSYENSYKMDYDDKNNKGYYRKTGYIEKHYQPNETFTDEKMNLTPNAITPQPFKPQLNNNNYQANYYSANPKLTQPIDSTNKEPHKVSDYYNQNFFSDYLYYNKKSNTFMKATNDYDKNTQMYNNYNNYHSYHSYNNLSQGFFNKIPSNNISYKDYRHQSANYYYKQNQYQNYSSHNPNNMMSNYNSDKMGSIDYNNNYNYNCSSQFNNYQLQIQNINRAENQRPKSNSFNYQGPNEAISDTTPTTSPINNALPNFQTSAEINKTNSDQLTQKNYLQIDVDKMFSTDEGEKKDSDKSIEKSENVFTPIASEEKKQSAFKSVKKQSVDINDQEDFEKLNASFNSANLEEEEEKMADFLKKHPDYNKEEEEESNSDESEEDVDMIIHDEESENEDDRVSDTKNNKIIFDMEKNPQPTTQQEQVIPNLNPLSTSPKKGMAFPQSTIGIQEPILQQPPINIEGESLKKNLDSEPFYMNSDFSNFDPINSQPMMYPEMGEKSLTSYQNFIFSNYANFFYRGRDSNMHREYFTLKCLEQEKPEMIHHQLEDFENKVLIPLYQKITVNVEKRKKYYYYTFQKYKSIIYKVLYNDKVLLKVEPYGSHVNNFLIDLSDIDICIVPKCPLSDFNIYLEKLKEYILKKKIGECRLTHTNNRYMLIKIIDAETKFVIDITVHNLLPILNTNLLSLYSLLDQRFHIIGIYLKYWSKINKIHGAADNYLSSYAILLMLIHFLQKIVEPKVLPNLQKLESKVKSYEYNNGGKTIKTNIYFEKDIMKIKKYMDKECRNTESATVLLIKFFEYYSYYFDYHNQKISIHKELLETVKTHPDNIAFSIDDPFDETHDPGRSMMINSVQFNKFLTAMKKEVNYILNGEYTKRLDLITKK